MGNTQWGWPKTIAFFFYVPLTMVLFGYYGLMSKKSLKWVFRNKYAISVFFMIQFIISAFLFGIPLLPNSLFNFMCLIAFFIGVKIPVVGLTGGIACGKSSVTKILKEDCGFTIIDLDQISHDLRNHDTAY